MLYAHHIDTLSVIVTDSGPTCYRVNLLDVGGDSTILFSTQLPVMVFCWFLVFVDFLLVFVYLLYVLYFVAVIY